MTVCWPFDWTASQLVKFLYWLCLTEYIIWNWKWCYLYCLTSVMQGNRLEESNWIPQQLFYCDLYIVIYNVIYNLTLIMCVWTIFIVVIWCVKYHKKYQNVEKGFSKYILKIIYLYKINGFYIIKEKGFWIKELYL